MAKTTGLQTKFYLAGVDMSADVASLTNVGYSQTLADTTNLSVSAMERIPSTLDGNLSISAFFDQSNGHATWVPSGAIPTTDRNAFVGLSTTVAEACLFGAFKQTSYYVSRPDAGSGAITCAIDLAASDGASPSFAVLQTAGLETNAASETYTAVDNAASSALGGRMSVQCTSIGSGSITLSLEDSADDITYVSLASFTAISAAGSSEIVTISGTIDRYTKLVASGTFTNAVVIVGLSRS
jgi:hypothetical protein